MPSIEAIHAPHLQYPPNTEPPTPENIMWDLMQHDADEKYYIKWEGEELSEFPAWLIFNPYSIGSIRKKWTVYFGRMEKFEFNIKREAENCVKGMFAKSKSSGKLFHQHKNSVNLKLFAKIIVEEKKERSDEQTTVKNSS